jgi:hypothetical protein
MLCSNLVSLNLQITNNVQFYNILLQEILCFTTNHFTITYHLWFFSQLLIIFEIFVTMLQLHYDYLKFHLSMRTT